MKPIIIGDLYMIKLKQTSKKGFSARSTGALSKKGVPDKSFKNKSNQDLYSATPIRVGIDENLNANIGVDSKMMALLHMYYRSSVLGRRSIGTELATNIKPLKDFIHKPSFKNRNVEILQAYFKFMGIKIDFMDKKYEIDIDYGQTRTFKLKDGSEFVGTKEEFNKFKKRNKIKKKYNKTHIFIGSKEEYESIIDKEVELAKTRKGSNKGSK